jgi:8-oxo-dGTP pyrophosphatase MutT (NUDIX family)
VVVARPNPRGVEVLMLRRSSQNRFGPGFVVFPGGSVDPEDADLAERWFGSELEAPRACAVRELGEEAAIAVTGSGPRLLASAETPIDAISRDPPSAGELHEISRWVAPEFLEVRFDARFFAVAAPADMVARPDGTESEAAWWARPIDVLEEHALWDSLMWPTYNMLKELSACRSVDEVLELRAVQVPPPVKGL